MGVEYTHYVVVSDPQRVGTAADARKIHAVLLELGLVAESPTVDVPTGDITKSVGAGLAGMPDDVANVRLTYPSMLRTPRLARVLGPSGYPGVADDDRYLQRVVVVVGRDFHVHPSDQSFCFEVVTPPMRGGVRTKPYRDGRTFPADSRTTPPEVRLTLCDDAYPSPHPPRFPGFWRLCVELFCGKDVPAFAEQTHELPDDTLVRRLADAVGCEWLEIGSVSP
jgi:hypothetical protein